MHNKETRLIQTPQGPKEMTFKEWLKSGPKIPKEFKKLRIAILFWEEGVPLAEAFAKYEKYASLANHKPRGGFR